MVLGMLLSIFKRKHHEPLAKISNSSFSNSCSNIFCQDSLIDEEIQLSNYDLKNFPEFQLNDLNGNPVQSDSLKGIKVLNVWASWCITCLVEHPFLTKLSEQNIQIIGLNYKDSDLKANAWLKIWQSLFIFYI